MSVITDEIDRILASGEIVRVVAPPIVAADDYGSDLDCADDLTEEMHELDADSPRAIAQANWRRINTRRGTLGPDCPDDGIDLLDYVNRGITAKGLEQMAGEIRAELMKDDRNLSIKVRLVPLSKVEYELQIKGETARGPFSLTAALTDAAVLLRAIDGETS